MKRMGPKAALRRDAAGGLSPARSRVLESLVQAADPVTASDLARQLGQHANTVREHLDALVERGFAERLTGNPRGRGRPAWRYSASDRSREPDVRVRDYAALALALAEHVSRTSAQPEADARAAGREWGRRLAEGAARHRSRSPRAHAVALLDELGFDPLVRSRGAVVLLRRCPFLDVAVEQSRVVCSAHHGMIEAVLEARGGSDGVGLLPFGDDGGCVVTFTGSGHGA